MSKEDFWLAMFLINGLTIVSSVVFCMLIELGITGYYGFPHNQISQENAEKITSKRATQEAYIAIGRGYYQVREDTGEIEFKLGRKQ